MKSIDAYKKSPYSSRKVSSYFQVYDQIFLQFVGKPITFVEIGVQNGGSLFMWREFFGPNARIIGVDLNPEVLVWKDYGFEIYIGSQSDKFFWDSFVKEVPEVDIVLDDGGHTFLQQITTVESLVDAIKPGGLIVVEDTHSSYMREFAPKKGSTFIDFSFSIVHGINYRFGRFKTNSENRIYSVQFFESIVVFFINPHKSFKSKPTSNNDNVLGYRAQDYRYGRPSDAFSLLTRKIANLTEKIPFINTIVSKIYLFIIKIPNLIKNIYERKSINKKIFFRHKKF
jgi:hypothetical protein